jgi:hypothetical protein
MPVGGHAGNDEVVFGHGQHMSSGRLSPIHQPLIVEVDAVTSRVDGHDGAPVAVGDAPCRVVAPNDDLVAGGELTAGKLELDWSEPAGGAHVLAGLLVEVGDVGAAQHDHQAVAGVTACPPVRHETSARRFQSRRDPEAVVAPVERERLVRAAVADTTG